MSFEELSFAPSLGSDNHSGVHPEILKSLVSANRGHAHAYGLDELSQLTMKEFKRLFGPEVEAQYVFTGTAANVLSLATLLKSHEAVICSEVAHLHLDECGAPEKFIGGKLWTIPSVDGKIFPAQAKEFLERRGDQHYSQPRMISLTQPTELGVCYSLAELAAWRQFANEHQLYLHIDGARLANAAVFLNCALNDITRFADVVSFGGTKNGMLGAEVVLLFSKAAKENFRFLRKQAMQLSSKTRFLAAQFHAYLHQDLWKSIARHSTSNAHELLARLEKYPQIRLAFPVHSNALFVHLPADWVKPLREKFFFYIWDSSTHLARWMISWDWTPKMSDDLMRAIEEVSQCSPRK